LNLSNVFQVGIHSAGCPPVSKKIIAAGTPLMFSKLFGYYGSKGFVLNEKTFVKNLGLKNEKGEYNMMAQILSDDSHIPLRVSISLSFFSHRARVAGIYDINLSKL
jgi:hypothetical protein